MLRYDVVPEGNIISVETSGQVTNDQITNLLHEIVQDQRIHANSRCFLDASGLDSSLDIDGSPDFNEALFALHHERFVNSRLAIFAPKEHQFDIAEYYLRQLRGFPIHARIFADLSIACLWLGIPVHAI